MPSLCSALLAFHWCRTLTKTFGWPVVAPRPWGGYFRNDAEHRDFVLIGTAAGLASAFSTPIGGLLLAIEQVCGLIEQLGCRTLS